MLQKLKEYLMSAKNRLFTLSSGKRIGKFALLLILLLDLQVLYLVIDGADKAGKFVRYPISPVSPTCEMLFEKYSTSTDVEKISFINEISNTNESGDGLDSFLARPDYSLTDQQANIESQTARACVSARDAAQPLRSSSTIRHQIAEARQDLAKIQTLQGDLGWRTR